ncbi:hypothetical protein [Streptomyces sp. NBC_01538]
MTGWPGRLTSVVLRASDGVSRSSDAATNSIGCSTPFGGHQLW